MCDYSPLKSEPYRVKITVGGDRLEYPDDALSLAASILDSKLIFNSTISDARRGARCMSGGKYFKYILIYSALDIGVFKKNISGHRT